MTNPNPFSVPEMPDSAFVELVENFITHAKGVSEAKLEDAIAPLFFFLGHDSEVRMGVFPPNERSEFAIKLGEATIRQMRVFPYAVAWSFEAWTIERNVDNMNVVEQARLVIDPPLPSEQPDKKEAIVICAGTYWKNVMIVEFELVRDADGMVHFGNEIRRSGPEHRIEDEIPPLVRNFFGGVWRAGNELVNGKKK